MYFSFIPRFGLTGHFCKPVSTSDHFSEDVSAERETNHWIRKAFFLTLICMVLLSDKRFSRRDRKVPLSLSFLPSSSLRTIQFAPKQFLKTFSHVRVRLSGIAILINIANLPYFRMDGDNRVHDRLNSIEWYAKVPIQLCPCHECLLKGAERD